MEGVASTFGYREPAGREFDAARRFCLPEGSGHPRPGVGLSFPRDGSLAGRMRPYLKVQVVRVVDTTPVARSGDGPVERGGYHQELKRTLGSFQVFAISFAFISVAVGIFGTYDDVLQNSGPVGIWLWVIVAIGQLLVALVIAQFAARISLSGSSYQWASRLA